MMELPVMTKKRKMYCRLLIIMVFFLSFGLWTSNHTYEVEDYAGELVSSWQTTMEEGGNIQILADVWLRYEQKNDKLISQVFWNGLSEGKKVYLRRILIDQRVAHVPEYIEQINFIERALPESLRLISTKFTEKVGGIPTFAVYLLVSPTSIDAKTQCLGTTCNEIQINSIHPSFKNVKNLDIILAHEIFHLYQFQKLNKMGAKINYDSIAGKLMAEGMATLASEIVVENARMDEVLWFKQNELEYLHNNLPELARGLLEIIHSGKKIDIEKYFGSKAENSKYPPRSGYYLGYVVAKNLANKFGFNDFINIRPQKYLLLLEEELKKYAQQAGVSLTPRFFLPNLHRPLPL